LANLPALCFKHICFNSSMVRFGSASTQQEIVMFLLFNSSMVRFGALLF